MECLQQKPTLCRRRDASDMKHAVEGLWSKHAPSRGYPKGVVPVPKPIPGIAFFPGGYGLWRPDPSLPLPAMPTGGIMVVGHDFHSVVGYRASIKRGRESETQPTWRVMLDVFARAGISPETCFFTNVYMGLRAGRATTGPFPGASDQSFVEHCLRFLALQLRVQRPSIVITLGVNVPPLLGRLSPALAEWTTGRGIKHLDTAGPVRRAVTFPEAPGFTTNVVALIHPSLRHASIRLRRYGRHEGDAAEIQMLKDTLRSRPSAT